MTRAIADKAASQAASFFIALPSRRFSTYGPQPAFVRLRGRPFTCGAEERPKAPHPTSDADAPYSAPAFVSSIVKSRRPLVTVCKEAFPPFVKTKADPNRSSNILERSRTPSAASSKLPPLKENSSEAASRQGCF